MQSSLVTCEYEDFRLKLAQKATGRARSCQIELTFNCTFSCLYCCLGSWRNNGACMRFPLARQIIDQLYKEGFLYLTFSGGEPLCAPDFFEIYRYAKDKGFLIVVLTNGSCIDEEAARFFSRLRPFYLEVPMHSLRQDVFERISGSCGSFEKVRKAIDLLKKYSIPFRLKTKAITLNIGELDDIAGFTAGLGVPYTVSALVHGCFDHDKAPLRYRLGEMHCLDENEYSDSEGARISPACCKSDERKLFSCAALRFSVDIDPGGRLMACSNMRSPSIDLMERSLGEAIKALSAQLLHRTFDSHSSCARCGLADWCSLCPGISLLENGTLDSPVQYFCDVARLRRELHGQSKKILAADR